MRTIGESLFRHELGAHLRHLRTDRRERLSDTAARAGISPQYLSEIERGLKDPSSEMLAAVAGALEARLGDIAVAVGERLREQTTTPPVRVRSIRTAPALPTPSAPRPTAGRLMALAA